MRVAVSSSGTDINAAFDGHFARCANFIVTDDETGETTVVANPGATVDTGAGPVAAKAVIAAGVDAVVTGWLGPHAYQALVRHGVNVLSTPPHTVAEALQAFTADECKEVSAADAVQRHGRALRGEVDRDAGFEPGVGMGMGLGLGFRHGQGRGRGLGRQAGIGGGGRGRGMGRGRR